MDTLTVAMASSEGRTLARFYAEQNDGVDAVPWLEELRKLRVDELKQEIFRHDLSIQSLEWKVKRMEEERERSVKDDQNEDGKQDLEKNLEERSENDRDDGDGTPEEALPVKNAGEGLDRDFNESNSTEKRGGEPEPVQNVNVKPDPVSSESKPTGEDSYNDSSDTAAKASQEGR
ncbi:DNA-binding bromodomain-containing protein [Actinidia rufa]|uniref:DNA-binding bromodomain-containing protein n=1 Tax=Actinidia rufa TaxID=165716 RepID=A0A7J0FR64_9ERIC|nr:DNA-binding bromodomain-containing protein [Actinidia rufa]